MDGWWKRERKRESDTADWIGELGILMGIY